MNENFNPKALFRQVRDAAAYVAKNHGQTEALHVDLDGVQLVQLPRPFAWLALFPAHTYGGFSIIFTVSIEREGDEMVARVPCNSFASRFSLLPYLQPLPAKPKSQGQVVSEAVFNNWKNERGS